MSAAPAPGPVRAVTIHGHFYQPPRENPWLEAVEVQDSAAPFHDWNARVTAECYAPNTAARRLDPAGRIVDIVNNFEAISFDVGPTLLAWLAGARPDVHGAIVAADRRSVERHGHGNALAHPWVHAILPLATPRDRATLLRWGLRDFRRRFGREPEGLWLPETAADTATLSALADHGLRFTVLAPRQAARVRPAPDAPWREVRDDLDPSRPYRWRGPGGQELALFFYDGPVSHAIAFEGLLRSGDALAARLLGAFDPRRPGAQLVHVATDGESYGHHHRFGEMALAAALHRLGREPGVTVTNYGAFLAAHPPREEAEVVEGSSWSCAHGVERWRADCGCHAGHPGWHQRWRGPLREALDWLRGRVDLLFEARGAALFHDPWAARDEYVDVLLDRSAASLEAFGARHGRRPLVGPDRVTALQLLELQRHALLMYSSDAWFFDDISGLEAVQALRSAARVVQLARQLGAPPALEAEFRARLARAPSNLPELGTGQGVYERFVLPAVADLDRVVAHVAIAAPYSEAEVRRVYCYRVARLEWARESYGETSLAVGRLQVASEVTAETETAAVAVLHFGGHDFHCAVGADPGPDGVRALQQELLGVFARHSLVEVVRALDQHFGGRAYGIRDLFLEERRRVLERVTEGILARAEAAYRQLYDEHRRLMRYLRESDARLPEALALPARYVLQRAVGHELAALARGEAPSERLEELLGEAAALGLDLALDGQGAALHLERALLLRLAELEGPQGDLAAARVRELLDLARRLGCRPDLWTAQNRFFALWRRTPPENRSRLQAVAEALGFAPGGP